MDCRTNPKGSQMWKPEYIVLTVAASCISALPLACTLPRLDGDILSQRTADQFLSQNTLGSLCFESMSYSNFRELRHNLIWLPHLRNQNQERLMYLPKFKSWLIEEPRQSPLGWIHTFGMAKWTNEWLFQWQHETYSKSSTCCLHFPIIWMLHTFPQNRH